MAGFWHPVINAPVADKTKTTAAIEAVLADVVETRASFVEIGGLCCKELGARTESVHVSFVEDDVVRVDSNSSPEAIQCTLLVRMCFDGSYMKVIRFFEKPFLLRFCWDQRDEIHLHFLRVFCSAGD
jgi:hypothetical protein